jgi:hypothetical protein
MKTFKLIIRLVLCYIALLAAALFINWLSCRLPSDDITFITGYPSASYDDSYTVYLIYSRFFYFLKALIPCLLAAGYSLLLYRFIRGSNRRFPILIINAVLVFALSIYLPEFIWCNTGLSFFNPFTLSGALTASCVMSLILVPIFNKLKDSKTAVKIEAVPEQDDKV